MAPRPVATIIAGPNGSGKSTLTKHLVSGGLDLGQYINADEIEAALSGHAGEERSRRAQELADRARYDCLRAGISFTFETVMSHPSKVEVLREARRRGYVVVIFFVATESPRLNIERIRQRVRLGGHSVPEDRITSRYDRSLALLPEAIAQCDRAVLFDNSYREQDDRPVVMVPVCEILRVTRPDGDSFRYLDRRGRPLTMAGIPAWARRALSKAKSMRPA